MAKIKPAPRNWMPPSAASSLMIAGHSTDFLPPDFIQGPLSFLFFPSFLTLLLSVKGLKGWKKDPRKVAKDQLQNPISKK